VASIDERIVSISFENAKFEAGVAQTMQTISKLNIALRTIGSDISFAKIEAESHRVTFQGPILAIDKLKAKIASLTPGNVFAEMERAASRVSFQGIITAIDRVKAKFATASSTTAFDEVERAADRISFSGLLTAIENVASRFTLIKTAASVALGGVAAQIAMQTAQLAKSLALGPIIAGFQEYSTNLNSIQTILANTQAQGTNLQDVNRALTQLNAYSDQTIYNFGQMANAIGLFTAAGVDLDTSVNAIKGIANLAALSGSNAEQATHAMQQLSQAVAAGKVTMQDWISVRNAGLGGEVFQKALFDTAKALGTIKNVDMGTTFEEWKKQGNSFTKSLSETQDETESTAKVMAKARKDAAETIKDAEEASAEAVEAAEDRVKDARESSAEATAAAAKRVKEAQESAAEATANAAEKVRAAHEAVTEAAKQAARDLRDAQEAQRQTIKQSAEDVKAALESVTEARKRLIEALKPPSEDELQAATDKLRTAQLDQADLADAITLAQREQTRAAQDLAAAQDRLDRLKTAGADPAEIQAATRALEDAQKRATDSADAVERAQIRQRDATRDVTDAEKDLQETREKGTKQDERVKDARDALTEALDRYEEAQRRADRANKAAAAGVAEARKRGAEQQRLAGERLAEAEKDQAKTIVDARESVAEAEKDQAKTIVNARESIKDAEEAQAKASKDAQERIAKAHEQAAKQIEDARKSTQKEATTWLTSEVLTKTLSQFTGDMTDAQLAAMGFNEEQIKSIQQMAKTAKASATEVKTLKQTFDVAKESIGSGWSETFKIIFGNFKEAKGTFTGLSNSIGEFIKTNAEGRNKVLKDWKELGGRTELIKGIQTAFENVMAILKPVSDAFHDIFPKKTADELLEMTKRFTAFAESLKPSPEAVDALRRIFGGLFAVFDIAKTVIGEVIGLVFDLFGIAGEGSGGFVQFLASIGDFLVAVDDAVIKGGALKGIFEGLKNVLRVPLELIKEIAGAIGEMFFGADPKKAEGVATSMEKLGDSLKPMKGVIDDVVAGWDKFVDILGDVKEMVEPGITNLLDWLGDLGKMIAEKFNGMNWNDAVDAIQTGLIAGIFLKISQAVKDGLNVDFGGGTIKKLGDALGALTDNLKAMQRGIQVTTLLEIAIAIGLLAAGIFVLSQIPADKLSKAMTAVAVGLAQLIGAVYLLTIASKGGLGFKIGVIAASMILLATAVTILAVAMKIMSTMSWEEIAKGIAGIAGALVAVGIATKLMNGPKLLVTAAALIPIAIALNLLAIAMKIMSSLKWEELAKGIVGIAGALGAIALAMSIMPGNMILTGVGLTIVAAGLILLSSAVSVFGKMDMKTMLQGLIGVAAAIMLIAGAMMLMPPNLPLTAAGLVLVAIALNGIATAVAIMGSLDIGTLVKGIIGIGGALLVLAGGLYLMQGAIGGAAALLLAAAALAILGPAIAFMGQLEWKTILKGLGAMVAILAVLAIVGALASAPLTALGLALGAIGLGMLVISAALSLFVLALAQLGEQGPKAIAAMVAAFGAFLLVLPKLIIDFLKGLVVIVGEIVKIAPAIAEGLVKIATTLLDAIIALSPKIAEAITALVVLIAQVLSENVPTLAAAGLALILGLLTAIRDKLPDVMETATDVVVKFIEGLGNNLPRIVAAGAKTLTKFLFGITEKIPNVLPVVAKMITTFLDGVTKHIPAVVRSATNMIVKFLNEIAKSVPRFIAAGTNIILKFMDGIIEAIPKLRKKALELARTFLNNLAKGLVGLVDAGFDAVIDFLHGIANSIRTNRKDLFEAGLDIAKAIVEGIVDGLGWVAQKVIRPVIDSLFSWLPDKIKKMLGIHSPSKVFMEIGENMMMGLAVGIQDTTDTVGSSMEDAASKIMKTADSAFGDISLEGIVDMEPVITPVLDLSQVEKDAKGLADLTNVTPITAAASYSQAAAISDAQQQAAQDGQAAAGGITFSYEQNNYSPEALSDVEIYRQTKNQLSTVRQGLGLAS
jgi:tape measure domain-containing protein